MMKKAILLLALAMLVLCSFASAGDLEFTVLGNCSDTTEHSIGTLTSSSVNLSGYDYVTMYWEDWGDGSNICTADSLRLRFNNTGGSLEQVWITCNDDETWYSRSQTVNSTFKHDGFYFVFDELATGIYKVRKDCVNVTERIVLNVTSPANNTIAYLNTSPISVILNYTNSLGENGNCSLYINSTLNSTVTNISDGSVVIINASEPMTDGNYTWFVECISTNLSKNTSAYSYMVEEDVFVGVCNASIPYPILNMTYFDENTGDPINLTNGYVLAIYDGTSYYNLTGSFANNYTDSICTNLPPSNVTYNWNAWGTLTLQKTGYVTRIFTIPDSTPYTISNNPTYNLPLSLIDLGNSSTIIYNWLTKEYQPIDGTLLIYKCNINGTRSLVESTPITTGQAIANIELITQPYSYEVIIGGVTYTDDSFTVCHIEAATSVTYYVDVIAIDLMPVIGLFLIDCTIEKLGNTTVKMSWSAHPYVTDPVQGCLVAYRQTITGKTQVYENCTNGSASSITRTIPDNPWDYFVEGYINQSGNVGYCQNTVAFHKETSATVLFDIVGLVAAVLMIMSLALMYAGSGENSVIAAGIGLVVSWILGVIAFDWLTVSAIIAFLAFIVAIGRYSRK